MSESTPQDPKELEKTATLKITLDADSGYTSEEEHRISPYQWGRICKILYDTTPEQKI